MAGDEADLREQSLQLREELEFLQDTWYMLRVLYQGHHGDAEDVVGLLNRISSPFFLRVQVIFSREVALGLCRLLDPPRSNKGDANLSLARLLEHPSVPDEARARAHEHLARIQSETATLRTLRHKRLAHSDESVGLLLPAEQWDSIENALVERVLRAVREAFQEISSSTCAPGVRGYGENLFTRQRSVHALLNALRAADPGEGFRWTRTGKAADDSRPSRGQGES